MRMFRDTNCMIMCFIVNIGEKTFGKLAAICQIRQSFLPYGSWTPSTRAWLHLNGLIDSIHKQLFLKNCLYAGIS